MRMIKQQSITWHGLLRVMAPDLCCGMTESAYLHMYAILLSMDKSKLSRLAKHRPSHVSIKNLNIQANLHAVVTYCTTVENMQSCGICATQYGKCGLSREILGRFV